MLEILGIIMLCNKNRANALRRGRNPSGFVALTICLWLGLEFIGAMIGAAAGMELGAYGLGILFAAIGALISYLAAKNCSIGNYVPQTQYMSESIRQSAQPLTAPAQIFLVRENSMVGALVRWDFMLNGQPIGSLGNGGGITVTTMQRRNILQARDAYGTEIPPFVFDVAEGAAAEIHFKVNKFVRERSRGFLPPAPVPAAQGIPQAPDGPVPVYPQPVQAPYGMPSMQAAAETVQPPNTTRAIWAAGFLLLAWLLLYAFQGLFEGRMLYNGNAAFFIIYALLGAGAFLILQKGVLQKCAGGAAGVLSALLSAFSGYASQVQAKYYGKFSLLDIIDFTAPYVLYQFLQMLFCTALVLGGAWLSAYLLRNKPEKIRLLAAGGIAACAYLLFALLRFVWINHSFFGIINPITVFATLLNILADTGIIFLSIWFLQKMCTMKRTEVQLRGPGLVWGWIAVIGMTGSLIVLTVQGMSPETGMSYTSALLLALSGLTGYILLLCKKRIGLYVLLAGTGLMLGSQFFMALTPMLNGAVYYASLFIGSIVGAVNPLLGFLSVRSADRQPRPFDPAAYGAPVKSRISAFDKFTAIFVLSAGGILFLLPVPFLILGDSFVAGMAVCMFIGLLVAGFGILCTALQHSKTGIYPMGLKVACIILFVLCAVVLTIVCIGALSSL